MNHCAHVAAYYENIGKLYRKLHWYRAWGLARCNNRNYYFLSIGITGEGND